MDTLIGNAALSNGVRWKYIKMSRTGGIILLISDMNKFMHKFADLGYCGINILCLVCNVGIVGYDAFNSKQHITKRRKNCVYRNIFTVF